MEKNKKLRDVFELYKEYTGCKDDYDSNTFSSKLRSVIEKYKLKDYIEYFKEKSEANEKGKAYISYAFTEEEAYILALLLACSTTRDTTAEGKYNNVKVLNPLTNSNKTLNLGISDLIKYMENFKEFTEKHGTDDLNNPELSDIFYIIEFASKFCKQLTYMIVSMFERQNYNDYAFEKIMLQIKTFTQELNLFDALCGECDPFLLMKTLKACTEIPGPAILMHEKYHTLCRRYGSKYHSIDVSVAATLADVFGGVASLDNIIYPSYEREYIDIAHMDYKVYLRHLIPLMVKDYYYLRMKKLSGEEWEGKFRNEFCRKFDIFPNCPSSKGCSVETLIFEMYINPEINRVILNEISLEDLCDKILNKIDELFEKKDKEIAKSEEGEYFKRILEQFELLFLMPFRKFHEEDMAELKNRINNNQPLSNN